MVLLKRKKNVSLIRQFRELVNLTQEDLEGLIGYTQQHISGIERRKYRASHLFIEKLIRVAARKNVKIKYEDLAKECLA